MKRQLVAAILMLLGGTATFAQSTVINGSRVYTAGASTRVQVANDGSTGTTVNLLAKNSTTGWVKAGTSDTTLPVLIIEAGAGTTGSAEAVIAGMGHCVMDATTSNTAGFYVIASTTTAGRCHAQSSAPTGWIIGTMYDNSTTSGSTAAVLASGTFNIAGAGSGTVTSIATTAPLGGGTITTTGTLTCATCVTSSSSLTDIAVVIGSGGGQGVKTVAGLTTDGTSVLTLGVAGTSVGGLAFKNATSGTITINPPTGALGTVTLTIPAATDTLVGRATTDTLTNKTINASNNTLSNITGSMMTSATVTGTQLAAVQTRRTCTISVGDTSGSSAITNAQLGPQKKICFVPAAATVVEVEVTADAGTPNVIVGRNRAGTTTNLLSSALATAASGAIACANTGGTTGIDGATTCSATLQNTSTNAGDFFELVSGTAGGTAKFFTVNIVYSIN